jgi:hypothetical protein
MKLRSQLFALASIVFFAAASVVIAGPASAATVSVDCGSTGTTSVSDATLTVNFTNCADFNWFYTTASSATLSVAFNPGSVTVGPRGGDAPPESLTSGSLAGTTSFTVTLTGTARSAQFILRGAGTQTINFAGNVDGGGSSQSSTPQVFELSLSPGDGTTCVTASQTGVGGTWVTLPGASDCTPPASKAGASLLGWATTPNFPVAIAQRQINNGWGTYESYNEAEQLVAVFIPAGRATYVSGSNNLYAIWNK